MPGHGPPHSGVVEGNGKRRETFVLIEVILRLLKYVRITKSRSGTAGPSTLGNIIGGLGRAGPRMIAAVRVNP